MRTKFSFPLFVLIFILVLHPTLADLRPGFYSSSCPNVESIVFNMVQSRFSTNKSITAALLRMFFHDCFSGNGCDASILIESTDEKPSEKDAKPNLTVRGYEIIDEAKRELEKNCSSTVSCLDIIALATRDAVVLAGGRHYTVDTGRRDGLLSNPGKVNLPGPTVPVPDILKIFAGKGFTPKETITLLGVHTVGIAHCSFSQNRLSKLQATGVSDSDMDQAFAEDLSRTCGSTYSEDPTTDLDHGAPIIFDKQYYNQTMFKRGVLKIDQAVALDASTKPIVSQFALDSDDFQRSFANAMLKLGRLQVLVNKAGEFRQNCRVFNQGNQQNPNKGRKQFSFPFNMFQNGN